MAIDKDTVVYAARLARMQLESRQADKLTGQLQQILDFIDALKQVDVKEVALLSHILPIHNVLREDIPRQSLSQDDALANAPQKKGSFFAVPKVIE